MSASEKYNLVVVAPVVSTILLSLSCGNSGTERNQMELAESSQGAPATTVVNMRAVNDSEFDFSEVRVKWADTLEFGALAAGASSDYQEVDVAYAYAFVRVVSGDEVFVLQPIDYVGAVPLEPGYYSYHLHLEPGEEVLLPRVDDEELAGAVSISFQTDPVSYTSAEREQ